MAEKVMLKNANGTIKFGYVGWSWTSFFFGGFPALFRGDFLGFVAYYSVHVLIALLGAMAAIGDGMVLVSLIFSLWWCSVYNARHFDNLKQSGFVPVGV